ncbi:MAG: sulfatase family protein [Bacteroidales bacterium]
MNFDFKKPLALSKLSFTFAITILLLCIGCQESIEKRPNILFCISDDQSYIHTSIQGTEEISTPNFDRVASSGILFNNAYCNASSCAPSRASILTGRNIWELKEGGLLFGALRKKYITFSHLLKQNGYFTGFTGKGYGPANTKDEPYHTTPIAQAFNELTMDSPDGISNIDYSGNFDIFLSKKDKNKPFFFWYGGIEPHRGYKRGIGTSSGKDISKIEAPGFLPDNEVVRNDIADYYFEIEWFDTHLGRMINALEEIGELNNTIIIITSDNGMPFPRSKTTCYDYGTHMPLAICWRNKIKNAVEVDDFISFTDFAPTILDAAGIGFPEEMTGRSFLDVLLANKSGRIDSERNRVFTALERHTYCRPGGMPYPIRTIRKNDWLYIVNFEPERWPAGNSDFRSPHQGFYGDIDAGPTREYLIANQDEPIAKYYYELSISKRPEEELYNVKSDPFQLNNLALDTEYTNLCKDLRKELFEYLKKTNDPRMKGLSPWDNYPYYYKGFERRHLKPIDKRDME